MTAQTNVVSAITLQFGAAVAAGHLNLACSVAFETLPLIVANPKFRMAQYARDVELASGYMIAAKTVQNAGTLASKLQQKFGTKIAGYADGLTVANVLEFAAFIKEQITNTTYTATIPDLGAWCDGAPSAADKRAKAAENIQAVANTLVQTEAAKLAADLQATVNAELEASEKAKKDAEQAAKQSQNEAQQAQADADKAKADKLGAEKRAKALEEQNKKLAAEQEQQRVAALEEENKRKEAEKLAASIVIKVKCDNAGLPVLDISDNQSPEFLEQAAAMILAHAAAIKAAQQSSMGAALVNAGVKPARNKREKLAA